MTFRDVIMILIGGISGMFIMAFAQAADDKEDDE